MKNELQDNFFFDRFLGFVERYDEVNNTNLMDTASKWAETQNFDVIYHYLKCSQPQATVCISHVTLANMTEEELFALQDFSKKMAPLLDEEKALGAELSEYLKKAGYLY